MSVVSFNGQVISGGIHVHENSWHGSIRNSEHL